MPPDRRDGAISPKGLGQAVDAPGLPLGFNFGGGSGLKVTAAGDVSDGEGDAGASILSMLMAGSGATESGDEDFGDGDANKAANKANDDDGDASKNGNGISSSMLAAAEAYMAKMDKDGTTEDTSGYDAYVKHYGYGATGMGIEQSYASAYAEAQMYG